jgi:hypothetical protein
MRADALAVVYASQPVPQTRSHFINRSERLAHKQPGYRFENDWEPEMSASDAKHVIAGIALPIYEEIKLNNTVINLDIVKQYLFKVW